MKVNAKLKFSKLAEQFQVQNMYKTRKSTKNQLSNFDLIEEIMHLSHILFAVIILTRKETGSHKEIRK